MRTYAAYMIRPHKTGSGEPEKSKELPRHELTCLAQQLFFEFLESKVFEILQGSDPCVLQGNFNFKSCLWLCPQSFCLYLASGVLWDFLESILKLQVENSSGDRPFLWDKPQSDFWSFPPDATANATSDSQIQASLWTDEQSPSRVVKYARCVRA